MKRVLLLVASVITLWGCNSETVVHPLGESIFTHHFISSFVDADELVIKQDAEDPQVFYLRFEKEKIVGSEISEVLYEKYGDTTYDRYVPQDPSITMCFANEFDSIDITSSADFGDIKAGESLAGVVMFRGASAKPYVDNGYKVSGNWTDEIKAEIGAYGMGLLRSEFHPVVISVSELETENLELLTPHFVSLRFTQAPEIKEHTITVSLVDNEKRHTAQIDLVFP